MIRNIRLKSYKGIKDALMSDLGSINVLAGRNNSGKSSVLEAIQAQRCTFGEVVGDLQIENCASHFQDVIKGYTRPNPMMAEKAFIRSVSSILKGRLVFENELDHYVDPIFKEMTHQLQVRYESSAFKIRECLNQIHLPARAMILAENSCLIPAKRQLDRAGRMNFSEAKSFDASGRHILSHLFYLKNQPVSSADYQAFLKVLDAFSFVTEGLEFNVVPTQDANLQLFFSDSSGKWYPCSDCGLGLQDILIIVSFIVLSSARLVMMEEPENHIHPDKQRRLLRFLTEQKNRQFILATHSSVFLDPSYINRAIFVERVGAEVKLEDRTKRTHLLKNLGYSISDNIGCDLIVLTEGPNDGPVLEVLCKKMGFWEDFLIKFWPLGGDNMARFDFGLIRESYDSNQVIALIDKDPKSRKAREVFREKCANYDIECIQLDRYAMENYVTIDSINSCKDLNKKVEIETLLPNKNVEDQIGFSIKKWLPVLFSSMAIESLKDTDLLRFCEKMKSRVTGARK